MNPVFFKHSNISIQPSGKVYSENVDGVDALDAWTDGEQCVSCWQMSWRERFSAIFFGRVWVSVLSGATQPPIYVTAAKEYLKEI